MLSPPTVLPFSVAADMDSKVFDFYFNIWSLSRLLCCVGSGFNVAANLDLAGLAVVTNTQVITIRPLSCIPLRCPHKVHAVQQVEGSYSGNEVLYHVTCDP